MEREEELGMAIQASDLAFQDSHMVAYPCLGAQSMGMAKWRARSHNAMVQRMTAVVVLDLVCDDVEVQQRGSQENN